MRRIDSANFSDEKSNATLVALLLRTVDPTPIALDLAGNRYRLPLQLFFDKPAESSKFPAGRKCSPTSSASDSARSLMQRCTRSMTTTRKRAPTSWSHACPSTRARGPPRQCARAAHRVEREGLRWRLCGVGTATASSGPRRSTGVSAEDHGVSCTCPVDGVVRIGVDGFVM